MINPKDTEYEKHEKSLDNTLKLLDDELKKIAKDLYTYRNHIIEAQITIGKMDEIPGIDKPSSVIDDEGKILLRKVKQVMDLVMDGLPLLNRNNTGR